DLENAIRADTSANDESHLARDCLERGNILYDRGLWSEALGAYDQATKENPKLMTARLRQAQTLLRLGRTHDAILSCTKYIATKYKPGPLAYFIKATAHDQLKQYQQAVEDYSVALNLALIAKAKLPETADQSPEGKRSLEEAVRAAGISGDDLPLIL